MELGIPFVQEYQFHPVRKWRFDYYFPSLNIAFEYDGLTRGGHTGVMGVVRDSEKINEAQMMGINVYRVNTKTVHNGTAYDLVRRAIERHGRQLPVVDQGPKDRKVLDNQNAKKRRPPRTKG